MQPFIHFNQEHHDICASGLPDEVDKKQVAQQYLQSLLLRYCYGQAYVGIRDFILYL